MYTAQSQTTGRVRKEEELMLYGRMLNEKKEMARVINNQYEESKFDFVPKINKKSAQLVREKSKYLLVQNGPLSPVADPTASPRNVRNLDEQMRYIGMTNVSH